MRTVSKETKRAVWGVLGMQWVSGLQVYGECVEGVQCLPLMSAEKSRFMIENSDKCISYMRKSDWNSWPGTDILKTVSTRKEEVISMSITAETAKAHANDPAVLCCRAEGGITIEAANLEDPAIFDELVDSGLLNLEGCLTIGQVLGAKLTKTSDSLCPLTPDNVEGFKDAAETEEASEREEKIPAAAVEMNVQGAVTTVKSGKVVISIKEGKDIYLELPI